MMSAQIDIPKTSVNHTDQTTRNQAVRRMQSTHQTTLSSSSAKAPSRPAVPFGPECPIRAAPPFQPRFRASAKPRLPPFRTHHGRYDYARRPANAPQPTILPRAQSPWVTHIIRKSHSALRRDPTHPPKTIYPKKPSPANAKIAPGKYLRRGPHNRQQLLQRVRQRGPLAKFPTGPAGRKLPRAVKRPNPETGSAYLQTAVLPRREAPRSARPFKDLTGA